MHSLIDYRAKCALSSLQFQFYNDEEILKLSVKEITNSQSLDRLLNPIPNGLYDLALGPLDKNDICMTCGMDYLTCPGHIGHIGLILPVFNPVLFKELIRLLRSSCSTCNTLLTSKLEKDYFYALMTVINKGLTNDTSRIHDLYTTIVNNTDKALLDTLSFRDQFDSLLANIVSESVDNHAHGNDTSIRNVLTEKFEILKNFCDVKLKQNRKQCPNCNIPLRVLRAEHSSKLFYAKGVSKRQMKKTKLSKPVAFDQQGDQQEPDVDIDNDELNDNIQKLALTDDDKMETLTGQAYLTPIDARKQIENLLRNEKEILNFMLGYTDDPNGYDLLSALFLNYIVVPPSKFRPISQYKDQKFENSQTVQLSKLLQENIALKELLNELTTGTGTNDGINPTKTEDNKRTKDTVRIQEKLQNSWVNIQTIVNTLYDSDLDKINTDTPNGLKQVLERKEGLFRKHMMGKRVNYAGRSVISPDVYIGTDEIGIPEVFARKLTYPQPVNSINFWEMRQLVLNGPDVYPGATYVQYGNGTMIKLKGRDYESRLAIAKQLLTPESSIDSNLDIKIVHRHLKNGDILLFNRQPTLHRPSVMAHKARVLPNEKTLRMHYSNCKAYNADFDGDEMNIHLPQNEIARAEAYGLIAASEHYLVPKDGTPLGGLIHDHIVGGVALTIRGRYFNRNDYQYLVYNAFGNVNGKMKFLPPAILKPTRLWTGKQVISTLLLNLLPHHQTHLNLEGKSKVSEKTWYRVHESMKPRWSPYRKFKDNFSDIECMSESTVIIRNGHLLCGVLDKAHYGSSSYSLVHCCYELYGGMIASKLLTSFGKLFTTFLQQRGFTLGVEDILLTADTQKPMAKLFKKTKKCGHDALAQVFNLNDENNPTDIARLKDEYLKSHLNVDDSVMKEIDLAYKGKVDTIQNGVVNLCFPSGLIKKFPYNNLQLMIQSGAKGSSVNSMQMSCLLGQQELEGRRPRLMPNGNTLPSFLPYDTTPNSGGFICSSFMSGLNPQEYFFHCMAGREGLVDTAVKTSRSGYLQRCLVKHLEGICVNYDLTVRDSDGSIIQFQYGEDSLSIEKTQFMNEKQFPFLIDNHTILTSNTDELDRIKTMCTNEKIDKKLHKYHEWKESLAKNEANTDTSPFINFSRKLWSSEHVKAMQYNERIRYIADAWKNLDENERKHLNRKYRNKLRLPITSEYNPDRYLGAISERLQDLMDNYVNKFEMKFKKDKNDQAHNKFDLNVNEFKELIHLKSLKSCITPGDCVGVLAAQSIGEPSTQMTLNTFHFAGRGDMNVTLGIPRLREILMVASANIKTPSMELPVFVHRQDDIDKLKSTFTRTLLWDCILGIEIVQTLKIDNIGMRERVWLTHIKFKFLSEDELKLKLHNNKTLRLYEILNYIETKFFKNLCISINKKYNQMSSSSLLHATTIRDKSMKNLKNINTNGEDNDEVNEIDKDDADNVRESGESSGEKLLERVNDELEYIGEDEEKNELGDENSDDDDSDDMDVVGQETRNQENDDNYQELEPDSQPDMNQFKKKTKKVDQTRINNVLNISKIIDSYYYDAEGKEWCELTLKLDALKPRLDLYSIIQHEAKRSYIAKVENIKRSFISASTLPEDKGCYKMITEGINIPAIIKHCDILDISKLYMNDIHMMASTFGIEAAVRVIINEMKRVFNAYGINVDHRHLSLIADYMTFEGRYKPFNRLGIKANPSPLQKMSFETCLAFFKDAYLNGQVEQIQSPSSCLVTGRMVHVGTGAFQILTKLV